MGVDQNVPHFVGVDVGTSSVKVLLVRADGQLIQEVARPYPMHHPQPGWAEHDPEDWWSAVGAVVKSVVSLSPAPASSIAGLAIVCQREPTVLLDRSGAVLCPSISWTDRRSRQDLSAFADEFGRERYLEITGVPFVTGSSLASLLWIKRHRPDVWSETRSVLFAKDYLMYRLTGDRYTDSSTPGRSGLLDIRAGAWSEEICTAAGIPPSLLPPIKKHPADLHHRLSKENARHFGLPVGTAVAVGGGDDASATLGGGARRPGDLCAGTGTASSWRIVSADAVPDMTGRTELAPHVVPGTYIREAVISSTGSSMRWFKDYVASFEGKSDSGMVIDYPGLIEEARHVPRGAGGLYFYPYLEGSAMPRFRSEATGVFFGITAGSSRSHMLRAIMEGIAFQYPLTVDMLRTYGLTIDELTLVDGEARSELWNQMKADVLGMDVLTPRINRAAGLGAAMLAGVAANVFSDLGEASASLFAQGRRYVPDAEAHEMYTYIRADYERVYGHLDAAFRSSVADMSTTVGA